MNRFWTETLCALLVGTAIGSAIANWDYDDTDNLDAERIRDRRSGMGLSTDNLTGCQYLTTTWGGITPRLDAEGNHVCNQE